MNNPVFSALVAALTSDVASLRIIVSALSNAQIMVLAKMYVDAANVMPLAQYIATNSEAKIQELTLLATI